MFFKYILFGVPMKIEIHVTVSKGDRQENFPKKSEDEITRYINKELYEYIHGNMLPCDKFETLVEFTN